MIITIIIRKKIRKWQLASQNIYVYVKHNEILRAMGKWMDRDRKRERDREIRDKVQCVELVKDEESTTKATLNYA